MASFTLQHSLRLSPFGAAMKAFVVLLLASCVSCFQGTLTVMPVLKSKLLKKFTVDLLFDNKPPEYTQWTLRYGSHMRSDRIRVVSVTRRGVLEGANSKGANGVIEEEGLQQRLGGGSGSDAMLMEQLLGAVDVDEDAEGELCLVEFSGATLCAPEKEEEPVVDGAYLKNLGILLLITWMWAFNTPAVRYMYTHVPHPPPILVMNTGAALAALTTVLAVGVGQKAIQRQQIASGAVTKGKRSKFPDIPLWADTEAIKGGAELGTYKFLGVGFNYLGISLTMSSQAAFFVQLTTIIVPVAQSVMGVKLGKRIWTAAVLALAGVAMLAADGAGSVDPNKLHDLILGDFFCLVAAVWYSCYDVRVNTLGKRAAVAPLTTFKTAFQSLYSIIALAGVTATTLPMGEDIRAWVANVEMDELKLIVGVMVFSGALANGIATLLQIDAQNYVGPSRAQLVYATNPLWNTALAVLFLGEQLDPLGYVGASLFFGALAIAATTPPEKQTDKALIKAD